MSWSPEAIPSTSTVTNTAIPTPASSHAGPLVDIRQRVAVGQLTTQPWDFARDLAEYEDAGLSAIGLAVSKIDREGRARSVEQFRRSPLNASSLSWVAGFTGANKYVLADTIDEGIDTLRLAHELGAKTAIAIAGPRNDHTRGHADDLVVDSLSELGDYAERLGVHLALQPMGPTFVRRWSFIDTLAHGLKLVRRIRHRHVGLACHLGLLGEESDFDQTLRQSVPWLKLVRLGDRPKRPRHENDQCWPGQGAASAVPQAAVLDRSGYQGYYEVDVWSTALWRRNEFAPLLAAAPDLMSPTPQLPDVTPAREVVSQPPSASEAGES